MIGYIIVYVVYYFQFAFRIIYIIRPSIIYFLGVPFVYVFSIMSTSNKISIVF